jgi:rhamnosyltransferase subunit B
MSNILFVAKGTGGDLVPFPKIGAELKQRGHHITLFSHCSYAGMAEQNGWDFVALDTPEQRQQIIDDGQLLNSPSGYPTYFRRHVFPRAVAEYEAIRERYLPGSTVLVTTHKACLVPLLAAEKLGIPLVRMFATVSELLTLPLMEGMYQAVLGEDLNRVRETIGLPPLEKWDRWLRKADRELALWPDWFAAPDNDWVVEAAPVGFIQETGEEISEQVMETLKGAEPPVLLTAGTGLFTDPKFYAASAEACRILDRRGLLVTI